MFTNGNMTVLVSDALTSDICCFNSFEDVCRIFLLHCLLCRGFSSRRCLAAPPGYAAVTLWQRVSQTRSLMCTFAS